MGKPEEREGQESRGPTVRNPKTVTALASGQEPQMAIRNDKCAESPLKVFTKTARTLHGPRQKSSRAEGEQAAVFSRQVLCGH